MVIMIAAFPRANKAGLTIKDIEVYFMGMWFDAAEGWGGFLLE